jgi:hypothetical protein
VSPPSQQPSKARPGHAAGQLLVPGPVARAGRAGQPARARLPGYVVQARAAGRLRGLPARRRAPGVPVRALRLLSLPALTPPGPAATAAGRGVAAGRRRLRTVKPLPAYRFVGRPPPQPQGHVGGPPARARTVRPDRLAQRPPRHHGLNRQPSRAGGRAGGRAAWEGGQGCVRLADGICGQTTGSAVKLGQPGLNRYHRFKPAWVQTLDESDWFTGFVVA